MIAAKLILFEGNVSLIQTIRNRFYSCSHDLQNETCRLDKTKHVHFILKTEPYERKRTVIDDLMLNFVILRN